MNFQQEIDKRFLLQEEFLGKEKIINKVTPLVSVQVQTYQHVTFIEQCLESILMQKTTFEFEIIVGEDESSDGTREICIEYAKKYPDKLRLFLRDRKISHLYDENGNFTKRLNGVFCRMSARGKYIALCEGDDYWTDPLKLQKQVDFLEANLNYAGCFHETQQIFEDGRVGRVFAKDTPEILTTEDTFATLSPLHTSSIVYRNIIGDLPEWFKNVISGDMALFSIISSFGPLKKISEIMSVYRKHEMGLTNSAEVIKQHNFKRIELMKYLNEFHKYKYNHKAQSIIKIHQQIIEEEKFNVNLNIKKPPVLAIVCPQIGAVSETFIRKHIEHLAPTKTVILTGNVIDQTWFQGPIKIIPIELGKYAFEKEFAKEVTQFFKEHSVTHILCEFGCIGGAVVELNNRVMQLPIYVHFHGQDASEFIRRTEIAEYYRWMGSVVDGVIAVSKPMAERLIKVGIPEEKIKIIHYGVVYDPEFKAVPEKNPCKFISVSRLVGKKGIRFVLKAFEIAKRTVPGITLDIIGEGPLRLEIENFISEHNLNGSVKLHGEQTHNYVLEMMNESSVFVQHSMVDPETGNREGLPLSILEASAHGLPVISTFHEGIPEAIEHEQTGFLVQEQDWELMSTFIIKLATDGTLRKQMGLAGREKILNDGFTKEAMLEKLREFIGLNKKNDKKSLNKPERIKRVLFVNHSLYPYETSGTPISTLNHALGMKKKGMDVAVLFPSPDVNESFQKQIEEKFILYKVPRLNKYSAFLGNIEYPVLNDYFASIKKIIDDFKPDLVQINDYVYMPEEIISLFKNNDVKVVRNVCNMEEICLMDYPVIPNGLQGKLCSGPESPKKCAECFLLNNVGKKVDEVTTELLNDLVSRIQVRTQAVQKLYSEDVDGVIFTEEVFKNYFTRFISIEDQKITTIHRGFEFGFERKTSLKKIPTGKIRFGFIGNVMFSKGTDVVLKAFEEIASLNNFTLDIYGTIVDQEYSGWIERLESMYPNNIKYHGSFKKEEIDKIADTIDVALVTSYFDTYNRVVRELMYLGVPIIATNFFGASIIQNNVNGLKIGVGDYEALAETMKRLILNPHLICELSKGVIQTRIPSLSEEISKMMQFYNYLLNPNAGIDKTKEIPDVQALTKLIAFYLPQYHPIAENDAAWGKGFTEWTNVAKAKPLFPLHYQPHYPSDLGYYDLRLDEVRKEQIDLAKQYGISGFCYYYYWFNGKQVLETPIKKLLDNKNLDFPFCVCWANENWTRKWDGHNDDIIFKQEHNDEDDISFIRSLIPYFKDDRYIKVKGKPLLLIYRTELFPDIKQTAERWRKEVRKAGIDDLYLVRVESFVKNVYPEDIGFDAAVEFAPDWTAIGNQRDIGGIVDDNLSGVSIHDYKTMMQNMLSRKQENYKLFRGVTPSWDNTARRDKNATMFVNSSPSSYQNWLRRIIERTKTIFEEDEQFIFINAWNEWAEGNHLEPDAKYGRAYLEATLTALKEAECDNIHEVESLISEKKKENEELIEELNSRFLQALEVNEFYKANKICKQIIEKESTGALFAKNYELLNNKRNKIKGEISWNSKLSARNMERSTKLIEEHKLIKAETLLKQILEFEPEHIEALINISVVKILQEEYLEAEEYLKDTLDIDPKNEIALENYKYLKQNFNTQVNVCDSSNNSQINSDDFSNTNKVKRTSTVIENKTQDYDYQKLVDEEIEEYNNIKVTDDLREGGIHAFDIWSYWSVYLSEKHWKTHFGKEVSSFANSLTNPQLLSLGCGYGGHDIAIAKALNTDYKITALDINPNLFTKAREEVKKERLNIVFQEADLNFIEIEENSFDIIYAHASLHHIINLENLFFQLHKGLKTFGRLIILDIIGKSGVIFWKENVDKARDIVNEMPSKYVDKSFNIDQIIPPYSEPDEQIGMEGVRQEEIVEQILKYFIPEKSFQYCSFIRLICTNPNIAPHFNLQIAEDRKYIESLYELDIRMVAEKKLRPTELFGVFEKRSKPNTMTNLLTNSGKKNGNE